MQLKVKALEMNKFNCWQSVKPLQPQREDEKPEREGDESRKNAKDGIRHKPKC
jgi:hypothetical protein